MRSLKSRTFEGRKTTTPDKKPRKPFLCASVLTAFLMLPCYAHGLPSQHSYSQGNKHSRRETTIGIRENSVQIQKEIVAGEVIYIPGVGVLEVSKVGPKGITVNGEKLNYGEWRESKNDRFDALLLVGKLKSGKAKLILHIQKATPENLPPESIDKQTHIVKQGDAVSLSDDPAVSFEIVKVDKEGVLLSNGSENIRVDYEKWRQIGEFILPVIIIAEQTCEEGTAKVTFLKF